MANLTKLYSDIDFAFTKKPVSADVALSYDAQAVIRSIRNILSTKHYDRLFNPDFGTNLENLLFENFSVVTSQEIKREVSRMLQNYEPRADLRDVQVSPNADNNTYDVTITFYLVNATSPTTITLLLERKR
jgi:phage baseplate assembly protein W